MYGTIFMTPKEYQKVLTFLKARYIKAKEKGETYIRDSLSHYFSGTYGDKDTTPKKDCILSTHNSICLGVCATELIFKKYKLPRYKRQNYQIIVK